MCAERTCREIPLRGFSFSMYRVIIYLIVNFCHKTACLSTKIKDNRPEKLLCAVGREREYRDIIECDRPDRWFSG